jgi:hypothetical protein
MLRSALPQRYIENEGTLFEGFETFSDWSVYNGSATLVENTSQYHTGSTSLKVTTGSGGCNVWKTFSPAISIVGTGITGFLIWIYFHDSPQNFASLSFRIGSDSEAIADRAKDTYTITYLDYYGHYNLSIGHWYPIYISKDNFTLEGTQTWEEFLEKGIEFIMIILAATTGNTTTISIDDIRINPVSLPRLLFTFDDGIKSVYDNAFPIMQAADIRGTEYINSNYVGTEQTGYMRMTVAELTELYVAGWTIGNHTNDHTNLESVSINTAREKIIVCRDWLIANGFSRTANHFCFPYGGGETLALQELTSELCETARDVSLLSCRPPFSLFYLPGWDVNKTDTLAEVIAFIESGVSAKGTINLLFHRIEDTPSSDYSWSTANFQALVNYVISRRIKVVTMEEWYKGLTNPRYRSLPLSRSAV